MNKGTHFLYSYRAFMRKELLEGARQYRILIITVGILFFSVADPILFKILPEILKSQLPGVDLSSIMDLTQTGVIRSHVKNLFQLSSLVIALSLMGSLPNEKLEKTLSMPVAQGASLTAVYLAKWSFYGGIIASVTMLDVFICTAYSSLLLKSSAVSYWIALKIGGVLVIYFILLMSILFALGIWLKRPTVSGILTLFIMYGSAGVGSIWPKSMEWLPQQLIVEANQITSVLSVETWHAVGTCSILIVLLMGIAIRIMSKMEWV